MRGDLEWVTVWLLMSSKSPRLDLDRALSLDELDVVGGGMSPSWQECHSVDLQRTITHGPIINLSCRRHCHPKSISAHCTTNMKQE